MVSHIPYISLDTYPKVTALESHKRQMIKDVAMLIPFTSREPAMFCLIALVLEFLLFKILFRNVFIIGDMLLEFIWDRCRWLICINVYIFYATYLSGRVSAKGASLKRKIKCI